MKRTSLLFIILSTAVAQSKTKDIIGYLFLTTLSATTTVASYSLYNRLQGNVSTTEVLSLIVGYIGMCGTLANSVMLACAIAESPGSDEANEKAVGKALLGSLAIGGSYWLVKQTSHDLRKADKPKNKPDWPSSYR